MVVLQHKGKLLLRTPERRQIGMKPSASCLNGEMATDTRLILDVEA